MYVINRRSRSLDEPHTLRRIESVPLAVLTMICKSPNLRISGRAQEGRVNVRHSFRVGPTWLVPHTRPIWIRPERVPGLFARGHVVESDQVGQMRQSRARDRLAEEDRREPAVAEDLDLFLVEHLDLVAQAEAAARFVCAKLENARCALFVGRRDFDLLMRIEGFE